MPNFILLLCTCYTCNDNKAESKVDCNISVAHTLNDMWSLLLYVELWVQLHESAKWKIHYSLAFISYREKKVTNRKCLMEKQRFKKKKHVLNATSTVVSRHEQQPYILYIYNLFLLKKTSNNLWSIFIFKREPPSSPPKKPVCVTVLTYILMRSFTTQG